jgi:tetratricopeptide (TPR) repeat protein
MPRKEVSEIQLSALDGGCGGCLVSAAAADDSALCVRGSGDDAIAACTRAINSGRFDRRNLAMIYSNRGLQWERKQDYDKAFKDHNEALRLDPTYAAGLHASRQYLRASRRLRARTRRPLRSHSPDPEGRGRVLQPRLHVRPAKATMNAPSSTSAPAWRWTPRIPACGGQRCWSRAVIGKQLQEAVEDCNKAQSLAPKIPQILGYRGFINLKLGQFDKALADYDAAFALTTAPDNAEWLYGRGVAKVRTGDARGGNTDIDRAKSIKADIAEDYAKYGWK